MSIITKIINAPKPYGIVPYMVNFLPIILCIALVLIVGLMLFLYLKHKPKLIILKPSHSLIIAIHAAFTMSAYGLLQYRWIVDQFEGNNTVEMLWALVESLFIFNIIWSVVFMIRSIIKYSHVEIDNE